MFRRLGLLTVIALLVRVAFAWVYIHSHEARALGILPFLFEPGNIAASLANGHGFASPFRVDTGPTAWMTPVYPLLLAGIFKVFGVYAFQAYLAAAGLNIVCSALTTIPIWFVAKRIGGERVATIAAVLWVVFPTAIFLAYESIWDTSLTALLAVTLLLATLKVRESGRWLDWCGYGLLWGFALMTNAALLSLLPFLLIWAGYAPRAKPLIAVVAILLCCVPWTVRNYRVFHTFVPLRSVGGLVLWLGNTPDHKHPISNQAERDRYVELGEIAYMSEKQSEAIDFIRVNPLAELRMVAARFAGIWTGVTSGAKNARFYWVVVFNLVVALGAVRGAFQLWRGRSPFALPLSVFPVIFPLVYCVAVASPRYRHPIDPVLVILTAVLARKMQTCLYETYFHCRGCGGGNLL